MARIRTIKPEFFPSLSQQRLSLGARVLFAGMFTEADDAGRMVDSAKLLAGAIFPFDNDIPARKVEAWLGELEEIGSIRRYEVDSRRFIAIPKWTQHQRISNPSPARHPSPPEVFGNGSVVPHEKLSGEGKGRDQGKGSSSSTDDDDRFVTAVKLVAARRIDRRRVGSDPITNPAGYMAVTVERLKAELREQGDKLLRVSPSLNAEGLADLLESPPGLGTVREVRELPDCDHCDNVRWVEVGDGFTPCLVCREAG